MEGFGTMPVDPQIISRMRALFPPTREARNDGLLCCGGDLRPERLLAAYSLGIFPWYDERSPILWWTLAPRCVLPLDAFHLPARSARTLRKKAFTLTWDHAFASVISACAKPRGEGEEGGTWIIPEMRSAYIALHELGYAHSVEVWEEGRLVGGLYGIGLERAFFGESMFHTVSEASRFALFGLVALLRMRKVILLDCQQETPHMTRMGACLIQRRSFEAQLRKAGLGETDCVWLPWKEGYAWSSESSSWSLKSK